VCTIRLRAGGTALAAARSSFSWEAPVSSLNTPSPEGMPSQIALKTPAHLRQRRDMLFRETLRERCERVFFGIVWSLQPKRFDRLVQIARLWALRLLKPEPEIADLATRPGAGDIVGIANDLSLPILLRAYAAGLFPHSHLNPPKWISLPERCVLFFDNLHISKRLKRLMRQGRYTVTFDQDFEGVIKACAGKREGHYGITWITPRIMRAYAALFDAGYVHSFEVWNAEGKLVGGGYGVALGRVFSTESQFSHEPNTSKIGFSVLNWHLARWGYVLNDGKGSTPTILDMGFRPIPRAELLRLLAEYGKGGGRQGIWSVEAGPDVVAGWRETNRPEGTGPDAVATG
jgi:leucyl/phenylalanyl-tRNA--protein transferase